MSNFTSKVIDLNVPVLEIKRALKLSELAYSVDKNAFEQDLIRRFNVALH